MSRSSKSQLAAMISYLFLCSLSVYAQSLGVVVRDNVATPQSDRTGKTNGVREVRVTFQSGRVTLAGSVLIPPGEGRHPAIVLTHGSGSGPQIGNQMFAD